MIFSILEFSLCYIGKGHISRLKWGRGKSSFDMLQQEDIYQDKIINSMLTSDDKDITIENTQFLNIHTEISGSAMAITQQECYLKIRNSFFEDCRSGNKGGAIYLQVKILESTKNCFHLCHSGTQNGADGSAIYAEANEAISTTFTTAHQCPKEGDQCWYGIFNMWYGDLDSTNINISASQVEFVAGLGHFEPRNKNSHIKFYNAVNVIKGNVLTFAYLRFEGDHTLGNIINNTASSGLVYFQDSQTTVKEFSFVSNKGPITYACVGISNGIFVDCSFDVVKELGIGFNATINARIGNSDLHELEMLNTRACAAPGQKDAPQNKEISYGISQKHIVIVAGTFIGFAIIIVFKFRHAITAHIRRRNSWFKKPAVL